MFVINRILLMVPILYFIGCGGGSSSSSSDTKTGYFIDAPVVGLTYSCGTKTATTGTGGIFTCTSFPVTFKIGNFELGTLTANTIDGNVYIQDILNIDRNNFSHSDVIKIGTILQSFDSDGDILTEIIIPDDANFSTNDSLSNLTLVNIQNLLQAQGITPVSESSVLQHLQTFSTKPILANASGIISIKNTAITKVNFVNTGGFINNCSILPSLPNGLTLNTDDCSITGTPTTEQTATVHTVTATNTTGNDTATISITINIQAPVVANASTLTGTVNSAISSATFVNTGGTIASCTVSPTLPTGLSLANDCTITGTPTAEQAATTHTVTATNVTGNATATISITVNIQAPVVANASTLTGTVNSAISSTTFVNTGGSIASCTVSPTLPTGLSLANDCTITGTPTVEQVATTHTVTATNATGNDTATVSITVSITVNIQAPVVANASTIAGTVNSAISSTTFVNTGGTIASCTVNPTLPAGLSLANDCTITGTPTAEQAATTHTVTATNVTGNATATVSITVNSLAPSIANLATTTLIKDSVASALSFTNSGGTIASCTISPTLPAGLSLANDCTITGTPTVEQVGTTYTVTASNVTGNNTATVSITINNPAFTASDALKEDQWYIKNTGTAPGTWGKYTDLTAGADMQVEGAWNLGVSGEGIVVTVTDDGVDFTHPDLTVQEVSGKSIQTLGTAAVGVNDHGTGCAGIIAARADTDGVVGIAPNAKLISHKILNGSSLTGTSYAQMLSDDVSQVSNHSYGPSDNGKLYIQSSSNYDAIKNLVLNSNAGKGHVLLFAAGNGRAYIPRDYLPSEINSGYAQYDSTETVKKTNGDYAGLDMSQNHPYVISVSGFDANDKDVTYAEAGPSTLVVGSTGDRSLGIQGTSNSTGNIVPETYVIPNATNLPSAAMATTGRNDISYVAKISHRDGGTDEDNGFNMSFNGTSAATPAVTGVAALIRSANTNLTWRDVRWILAKTARKIQAGINITNQATAQPSTGAFAKPIWSTSGNAEFGKFSHYFGYGAADAGAAVALVRSGDYALLPTLVTCTVTVSGTTATIPASGCPSIIEFVQVKFQATTGLTLSDATFTMQHNSNTGKIISLIAPTTCSNGVNQCDIQTDTVAKTGTVGFLGDTLSTNDTFTFSISNSDGANAGTIVPQEITVYGYTVAP